MTKVKINKLTMAMSLPSSFHLVQILITMKLSWVMLWIETITIMYKKKKIKIMYGCSVKYVSAMVFEYDSYFVICASCLSPYQTCTALQQSCTLSLMDQSKVGMRFTPSNYEPVDTKISENEIGLSLHVRCRHCNRWCQVHWMHWKW